MRIIILILPTLPKKIEKNIPTIWSGDFNTVLDPNPDLALNIDIWNWVTHPGLKTSMAFVNIRCDLGLIDTFRHANGERK